MSNRSKAGVYDQAVLYDLIGKAFLQLFRWKEIDIKFSVGQLCAFTILVDRVYVVLHNANYTPWSSPCRVSKKMKLVHESGRYGSLPLLII